MKIILHIGEFWQNSEILTEDIRSVFSLLKDIAYLLFYPTMCVIVNYLFYLYYFY